MKKWYIKHRPSIAIALGFLAIIVLVLVFLKSPTINIGADVNSSLQSCPADKNIVVIVVDVNESGAHTISAYNKNGNTVVSGQVSLAAHTYQQIGEPSCFAQGNPIQATPLGIYKLGKTWSSDPNDPNYNSHIGCPARFGPLFIDLSGNPVDGGYPLCGLPDSGQPDDPNCRNIGIHSADNLGSPTLGCIKAEKGIVQIISENAAIGTSVIVTDYPLKGNISPVDPESYDPNFHSYLKIAKTNFKGTASVTGDGINKIYNFKKWWLAEVAKPTGDYLITARSPGYRNGKTKFHLDRNAQGQYQAVYGSKDLVLGLDADGMYSSYFSAFYPDNYEGGLRVSSWDTTFTNINGPYSAGNVNISLIDYFPKCLPTSQFCQNPPSSTFAVRPNLTPWHDLGYGVYNKASDGGPEIGSFTYNYGSGQTSIRIPVNTSLLTENQLYAMKTWGIAIYQKSKNHHSVNDYLVLPPLHTPER